MKNKKCCPDNVITTDHVWGLFITAILLSGILLVFNVVYTLGKEKGCFVARAAYMVRGGYFLGCNEILQ